MFESSADSIVKFSEAKRNKGTNNLEASASEVNARKKLIEAQLALEKSQAELDKFRKEQSSTSPD